MSEHEPRRVLVFEGVTSRSESHLVTDLVDVSFTLSEGSLTLIRQDMRTHDLPLFDLAEGLREPDAGRVVFLGKDWRRLSLFESARRRGLIGRVFDSLGWVSNLDVYENIVLAQQHHTLRSDAEILAETESLMRAAGFDAIPGGRPHLLRRDELRRAQWVRAFLGDPALILLERPEADVHGDDVARLVNMVLRSIARGAAVVWLSPDPSIWHDSRLASGLQFVVRESQLVEAGKEN